MKRRYWIVALLVSASGIVLYFSLLYQNFHTVIEGELYRSSQLCESRLEATIEKRGILSIVNLRGINRDKPWFQNQRRIVEKNDLSLYNVSLTSNVPPGYNRLQSLVTYLQEAERPLLLHCHAGVDRTGLASALALALADENTLEDAKRQFSWKYGRMPFRTSTGPLFFSAYEQWLSKNDRNHTPENLVYFIDYEYVDDRGNIEYVIDGASGSDGSQPYRGNRFKISVSDPPETLTIWGWAFDPVTNSRVEELSLVIHEQRATRNHVSNRPDVAQAFNLDESYQEYFPAGWQVEIDRNDIPAGCHEIDLIITNGRLTEYRFPTPFILCLDK